MEATGAALKKEAHHRTLERPAGADADGNDDNAFHEIGIRRDRVCRPSMFLLGGVFLVAAWHVTVTQKSLRQLVNQRPCETATIPKIMAARNVSDADEGWHDIHVFYGSKNHTPVRKTGSELKQDEIVLGLLNNKKNGFFVDLAAHHATFFSNTYQLEREGVEWSGICIEANPAYWRSLSYRKCHVVGAAVGQKHMEEVKFAIGNIPGWEGIAKEGFDNDVADNSRKHLRNKLHDYFTVTIKEVLSRFDAPRQIDYMSLDVEGAESYIMSGFPFDEYKISLLTIERPKPDLVDLLKAKNYTQTCLLSKTSGETLWSHSSVADSLNFSSLSPSICLH